MNKQYSNAYEQRCEISILTSLIDKQVTFSENAR